jgi:HlyD family secretion protein
MAKQSNSKTWIVLALVLGVPGLYLGGKAAGWWAQEAKVEIKGARARRGALTISVVQRGNLAARDAVSIKSEIEGQSTIIQLIPEGTQVKVGDVLCKLDTSELVDKQLAQEISVQNAEAAFTKAKAQYDIQASQNKSDIETAERKLQFAKLDLEKYEKGDYGQKIKESDDKILLAEQERAQAENNFNWSRTLADQGFLTKTELDGDSIRFQSSNVKYEQAKVAKSLLERYDHPRKLSELQADLKEAERGLERAHLKATSLIVDYEAGLRSSEAKLKLEREKLNKFNDQIEKSVIKAPAEGMVVYARIEGGGRMGGEAPIQEGTQIRERQEILQIPRTGGMIAEASVHESALKQVTAGLPCKIQVDALPGMFFDGDVQYVAMLPDKASWWANPNQRLYKTQVIIRPAEDASPETLKAYAEMRPGMSCGIEVFADTVADCVHVPVQCIVMHRGETIAFVMEGSKPVQRKVRVGRSNEKFVEVVEGIQADEEVLLAPPAGFVPQPADEKAKDVPQVNPRAKADAAASAPGGAQGAPAGGAAPTAGSQGQTGKGAAAPQPAGEAAGQGGAAGERQRRSFDPANMPPEMRARWEAMSPEEREQMMERMRSGGGRRNRSGGEGGSGGGGGGGGGG